jgi:alpha,alpha-trehalose phosphorylase
MHRRGDAFTQEQKARNFDYYEALTVRDSSLSACTQAVIAAEVGYPRLAYDYLAEAALMDLDDFEHDTRDGLAGSWIALVAGLGGMRQRGDTLHFAPRLPEGLSRLAFTIFQGRQRLAVEVSAAAAAYTLLDGTSMQIVHHGQPLTVRPGGPVPRPIPPAPARPEPTQPPGREPARRRPPTGQQRHGPGSTLLTG